MPLVIVTTTSPAKAPAPAAATAVTPSAQVAAGVAIATGVLMRKLSFGDEEKMSKGKKVIINAIVCYGIIISIDIIIKFVESVLK